MKTQHHSEEISGNNEPKFSLIENSEPQNNHIKKVSGGIDYHDYVPKHSNHGRSNSRTFGSDHEPGTMR